MKTKINQTNLLPYVGKTVSLYCQVGVLFNVTGKLVKDFGFCYYGIELTDGNVIGFSYGEFLTDDTAIAAHIYIS